MGKKSAEIVGFSQIVKRGYYIRLHLVCDLVIEGCNARETFSKILLYSFKSIPSRIR